MNILALDIGGTAIKSALFDDQCRLLEHRETPSDGKEGGPRVLARAMQIAESYAPFERIGISTAGQVNAEEGMITFANENIPGYTGAPVKAIFEERFGCQAAVLNDVQAAALGEAAFGAGKPFSHFVCITLGTGIGGGIFIDGKPYRGMSGVAGEVGHLITHPEGLPCACGGRGCWEQYASVTALLRSVRRVFPIIQDGKGVFSQGPHQANLAPIIEAWIQEIVLGLASLTHVLNPECFVLGGGIMAEKSLLDQIDKALHDQIMPGYRQVRVLRAALGNLAGVYGAMEWARQTVGPKV